MKKIVFLFLCCFLCSCTCMLSQIPPQKIYAGAGCSAPIPDYLTRISASDNCEIASLIQTPPAGTMLSASNKTATVTVKAIDASGNFKQVSFTVTLLDTVKPVLTIDHSLLSLNMEQINDAYDFGDRLVYYAEQNLDNVFPIDSFPGLRDKWKMNEYMNKMLVVWTSPGKAVTGNGNRYFTFVAETDTLLIRK